MNIQLSPQQANQLLQELCVVFGFCLSPDAIERLVCNLPSDVDELTDAIIRAEGLDPFAGIPLRLRRDLRARVAQHLRAAEDAAGA